MDQFPMNPYGSMFPAGQQPSMLEQCKINQLNFVQFETSDGQMVEGIIDKVDEDGVELLVPAGDMDDDMRQFDYGYGGYGFGYQPYGFGFSPYGYGYPRRFRRFRRRRFPFFFLRRLLFPIFY